ncbi:hypothetical protein WA577_005902, partial [Blastocystis sp. JDR]
MFIECYISLGEESAMRNMVNHLASLGFGGAAFVHEVVDRGVGEEDRCTNEKTVIGLLPLQHTALYRNPLIKASNEFRVFNRLSLTSGRDADLKSCNSSLLDGYDLVSFLPENQYLFECACDCGFIDIIEIPIMDGVYIHYTKDNVTKAINRGIMFEFSLASSFREQSNRRALFNNCEALFFFGRGNNILFSSDPNDPLELRNPNAYVAIGRAMGLSPEKAVDAVYRNPQRALEHAKRRKAGKEGIE